MSSIGSMAPVLNAERRAWSYWFVDGLANLVTGALCLLLAGSYLLVAFHPHTRSPLVIGGAFTGFGIYAAVFFRLRQTLEWLKSRITYPRTGYTAAPSFTADSNAGHQPGLTMLALSPVGEQETEQRAHEDLDARRRGWFFAAVLAAEVISTLLIHETWICAIAGIAMGVGIWLVTRNDERMAWVVALGLPFAEIYMFLFPTSRPRVLRAGFFLAGTGVLLAFVGAIALARYLRRNPVRSA
jgi:multisubunit Na+/H+ antiporter MnhF subunit